MLVPREQALEAEWESDFYEQESLMELRWEAVFPR